MLELFAVSQGKGLGDGNEAGQFPMEHYISDDEGYTVVAGKANGGIYYLIHSEADGYRRFAGVPVMKIEQTRAVSA